MDTSLLLKMKGRIEIFFSEPEPKFPNGANSDILGLIISNSPQRCTSDSAVRQNVPKSKWHQISTFPNWSKRSQLHWLSYSLSAMVMYVSKLSWACVRFGPVPLASCGNTCHEWIGYQLPSSSVFYCSFSNSTWEHSESVVECLTRDRGAAGSSLTCVTVLYP